MRVCGVELKGGEAVLCLLEHDNGVFTVLECRQRLISVSQSANTDTLRDFHYAFAKLMQDYQVDTVVIIERHQKGKLAGSATSFKLEAAIQLIDLPVELITPSMIKEQIKLNKLWVDFESLELKKFQKPAFEAAFAYQNYRIFS
ncbi:MAG: DUF3010 family protein [Spongiibacteraceae bacterium]